MLLDDAISSGEQTKDVITPVGAWATTGLKLEFVFWIQRQCELRLPFDDISVHTFVHECAWERKKPHRALRQRSEQALTLTFCSGKERESVSSSPALFVALRCLCLLRVQV